MIIPRQRSSQKMADKSFYMSRTLKKNDDGGLGTGLSTMEICLKSFMAMYCISYVLLVGGVVDKINIVLARLS